MSEIGKFIDAVERVFNDIKKVDRETNNHFPDMAVFLSEPSKKFLDHNKDELKKLFALRLQRDYISFRTAHIWKENEGDKKSGLKRFNK